MFEVVARKPAVFTVPVEPMRTPLGLITHTLPLEYSVPLNVVAAPLTRLRVTELSPVMSLKFTSSPLAVLNPVQLITALGVLCTTVVETEVLLMLAVPAATVPPLGSAFDAVDAMARVMAEVISSSLWVLKVLMIVSFNVNG